MEIDASLFTKPHRHHRSSAIQCAAVVLALQLPLGLAAAPTILEPTASLKIPDGFFTSIPDVDIDGDSLIMGVWRIDSPDEYEFFVTDAAFLYRRNSAGSWQLERKLFETRWVSQENNIPPLTVAMDGGLAAVNHWPLNLQVYRRSGANWIQVPANGRTMGRNLEIDASTILGSQETCGDGAEAFRENAGTFSSVHLYEGVYDYCDGERIARDSDIWGTRVVVPQPAASDDPAFVPFTYIWEGIPPSAPTTIPEIGPVAIEGDWFAIGGTRQGAPGTQFYRRQGLGNWLHQQSIAMPDALPTGGPTHIQMDDGFVMQTRGGNIEMFQRDSSGKYQYVAKLLGAGQANVSGRTVVGLSDDHSTVKIFDLPVDLVQPEIKQDDFEDRNAADWMPQAGSNFTVVSASGSFVYRQSSLAGNAISILGNSEGTNQAVQADIKPTAFATGGSDRWFGLIVRYTDPNNYYYVTTRASNVIQLRRIVNGVFQPLASIALPVTLNRTYNVRLEAIGTLLRLYVDNKLMLETRDFSHSRGQAGVMTYKTAADYDNVIVSTQQLLPLLVDNFDFAVGAHWNEEGVGAWAPVGGAYEQASLAGTARSITGIETEDQIVQARTKPLAFASGAERWFGLIARYVDASNYYYVTLRSNNTISLRKLVNGAIQVLDSAPLGVSAGTSYRVRLEAIDNSLRVHVNGRLVLEASDTTFSKGRYGLATFKTRAQFDDFLAVQP